VTALRATPRLALAAALSTVAACDLYFGGAPDAGPDASIDATPIDGRPIDGPPIDGPDGDCRVGGTPTQPALVVTDPTVLARFGFARVMERILTTAQVAPGQTARATFQQWMRTFGASPASGDCDDPGIDPERFGLVCPRPPEARLALVDPFTPSSGVAFEPLGLFNRFDLAPADGSNCGEYRIVYAMQSRVAGLPGRALIIFEGVLPNPTPGGGIDACLPVARFWQGLGRTGSSTEVADALERFYLTGGAVAGFPAVVAAHAYGLARGATADHGEGQIRTNFFIDSLEWQLREFKLRRTCADSADPATCRLTFAHVTVKSNPAEELMFGHPRAASFQSQFVAQVPRLVGRNPSSLSLAPADVFNEYESVSSRTTVDYATGGFDPAFRSALASKLASIGSPLSPIDVLRRATTQTCAGCHQVSNNAFLGGGMVWPPSLEFVHIDENRRLSPALTTAFLPHRRQVLENFINARCDPANARAASDVVLGDADIARLIADGATVGGGAVGAPN
jgi:hypothetical protein